MKIQNERPFASDIQAYCFFVNSRDLPLVVRPVLNCRLQVMAGLKPWQFDGPQINEVKGHRWGLVNLKAPGSSLCSLMHLFYVTCCYKLNPFPIVT